ncbi:hypothetical protein PFISCL1PPCAC_9308, partial [Pristionchus fissidentatus]
IQTLENSLKSSADAATAVATLAKMVVPQNEVTSYTFRVRFSEISRIRDETDLLLRSKPARIAGVDWVVEVFHKALM